MNNQEAHKKFWDLNRAKVYMRHVTHTWEREHPRFLEWARGYPNTAAFILAPGPSVEALTPEIVDRLRGTFAIGVNACLFTANTRWHQEGARAFPASCILIDRVYTTLYREYEAAAGIYRQRGGKYIISAFALLQNMDWQIPTFSMPLHDDLAFGLSDTAQTKWPDRKCTTAAIHLAALIGFRNVFLLGVDHGDQYFHQYSGHFDSAIQKAAHLAAARNIYGTLGRWMKARGQKLWQCGEQAAWDADSVERIPLGEALKFI